MTFGRPQGEHNRSGLTQEHLTCLLTPSASADRAQRGPWAHGQIKGAGVKERAQVPGAHSSKPWAQGPFGIGPFVPQTCLRHEGF